MKTLVEKSSHYNNFDDTGDSLVNGSTKDTMVSIGYEPEQVHFEHKEVKGKRVAYHYPDISASLYVYTDGSYGVISD
jgi:hypothetical protein